ncbi:MAG: YafY family transcriptional regulator [Acidobacteria bacterium]|nr:YafY family transcriptional regulator [Acidobacteriota bacterium]
MRRADRLFQIVQHLRARRLTTASQLASLLQVSERTVYRDIRDLSLSGVPIHGEAGVGYRVDRSYELTALMFNREEVEAVVVGLRMVQAFAGPRLRAAAVPALDKVILALPAARRSEIEEPRMFAPVWNVHRSVDEVLELIRQAIEARQVIAVRYADEKQQETERRLRPLALHFWGASWTLAAWCELRVGFRTFRLDRMKECRVTMDRFQEEEGHGLEDYLRMVSGE